MHPLEEPIPPGLVAVAGGEQSGKTSLLRRLCGELAPLPGERIPEDALWLDLSLPGQDTLTPLQVADALHARCPRWNSTLHAELLEALALGDHLEKQLFMLSTGSRRKAALAALLASGATIICLDQPYAALDQASIRTLRGFLRDMATHPTRSWVVADYEADAGLPWKREIKLG